MGSTTSLADPGRTVRWRRRQLLAAGYDELAARRLAADPDADIHALVNLVEACRPERRSHLGRSCDGLRS